LLLLSVMMVAAYYYNRQTDITEVVPITGLKLVVADGDSFSIGSRRLRLDGIDAPEYHQICQDERAIPWECGKAARASLEQRLLEPGLRCTATVHDQYARSIAHCANNRIADIGAAQVTAGMAISDDFYGIRSYGEEENSAQAEKRGIWRGEFMPPREWRANHVRAPQG
jgi:endonuclease YncB( thermonuclease family)